VTHHAFLPTICDTEAELDSAMQTVRPVARVAAIEMAKLLIVELNNRNIPLSMSSVRSSYGGTWTTDDARLRIVMQDVCRQAEIPEEHWGELSKDFGREVASLGVSIAMVCARAQRNHQFKQVAKMAGAGLLGGLLGGMMG
jgi:hypothetical protein